MHGPILLMFFIGLFHSRTTNETKDVENTASSNLKVLTVGQSWGYSFLFVTIINILAANGAFLYKLLKVPWFKILILSLMAFSVGVLSANSIVNLIPIGFGLVPDEFPELSKRTWLWKSVVILFGILLLAMVDTLIRIFVMFREMKNNNDFKTINCHHDHIPDGSNEQCLVKENGGTVDSEDTIDINTKVVKPRPTVSGPFYALVCLRPSTPSFAMLIIFGDAIHNFIDGLAMGSTFSKSFQSGVNMFISIASEELPHELGDFAALLVAGFSVKQALFWNIFSSFSCYLGMVLGLLLGPLKSAAPYIEVFCGGVFIYVSFVGLYPEVMEEAEKLSKGNFKKYLRNVAIIYISIILGMAFIVVLANVTIHVPL